MSALLLDTSAVIGLLERQTPSLRRLVEEQTESIHVSIITLGELQHGVEASTDAVTRQHRRSSLDAIKNTCAPIDVTTVEAVVYGDLSARLRRADFGPRRIGAADRWIAATAIARGLALVTQDAVLSEALMLLGYGDNVIFCD